MVDRFSSSRLANFAEKDSGRTETDILESSILSTQMARKEVESPSSCGDIDAASQ